MLRGRSVVAEAFHYSLVAAGWVFAVVLPAVAFVRSSGRWQPVFVLAPFVGIVLGSVLVRKPGPARTQGALILALSLFDSVMWSLFVVWAPVRSLVLGS